MAASERKIRISQLVHKSDSNEIPTAVSMFSGSDYKIWIVIMFYGQTGSGQFKIAASKLLLRISQLVHQITTKFQRLNTCFGVKISNEDSGNVTRSLL